MLDASGSAIAEYELDADTRMIDNESKVVYPHLLHLQSAIKTKCTLPCFRSVSQVLTQST